MTIVPIRFDQINALADLHGLHLFVTAQAFQEVRDPALQPCSVIQEQLRFGRIQNILAARRPIMRLDPRGQQVDNVGFLSPDRFGKFVNGIKASDDVNLPLHDGSAVRTLSAARQSQRDGKQRHREDQRPLGSMYKHK
ncbi:hypothetical protein D3C81_1446990 [compost metagenome]